MNKLLSFFTQFINIKTFIITIIVTSLFIISIMRLNKIISKQKFKSFFNFCENSIHLIIHASVIIFFILIYNELPSLGNHPIFFCIILGLFPFLTAISAKKLNAFISKIFNIPKKSNKNYYIYINFILLSFAFLINIIHFNHKEYITMLSVTIANVFCKFIDFETTSIRNILKNLKNLINHLKKYRKKRFIFSEIFVSIMYTIILHEVTILPPFSFELITIFFGIITSALLITCIIFYNQDKNTIK